MDITEVAQEYGRRAAIYSAVFVVSLLGCIALFNGTGWLIAGLLILSVTLTWVGLEVYALAPIDPSVLPASPFDPEEIIDAADPENKTVSLVLLLHGTKENSQSWPEEMERKMVAADKEEGVSNRFYINVDWSRLSEKRFRAAKNGMSIGQIFGQGLQTIEYDLMERDVKLVHIHVISHGSGAFLADSFTQSFKECGGKAFVHATYLSPFCLLGVFDMWYGNVNFGRKADFAECYFNDDDVLESTHSPLVLAYSVNVTNALGANDFIQDTELLERLPTTNADKMKHWWPVYFFMNNYTPSKVVPGLVNSSNTKIAQFMPGAGKRIGRVVVVKQEGSDLSNDRH